MSYIKTEGSKTRHSPDLPDSVEAIFRSVLQKNPPDVGLITKEDLETIKAASGDSATDTKYQCPVSVSGNCDVIAERTDVLTAILDGLEVRLKFQVEDDEQLRLVGGRNDRLQDS